MEADEDPYYPFEESVRPTEPVSVNGINGINGGSMDNTTNGRTKKKKKGTVVSPPKPYKVMRINSESATENPGTQTEQQLTRRALLRDAELTPRDLRRIDPSLLQTNNTPALLVNDQTILVNLGVRVIIRPDHALLFEPDTATARRFLAAVEQRQKNSRREQGLRVSDRSLAYDDGPIRGIELENGHEISGVGSGGSGGSTDADASVDKKSDYDLDETPGGVGGAPIPFELEVVEAALQETTSQLYAKMEFCEERCRQVSKRLQSSINPAVLEELRLTKQSLVELDSRAGAVRQVLLDTLDDDDDITDFTDLVHRGDGGGEGGRGGGGGEPHRVLPAADGDGALGGGAAFGEHARPRRVHQRLALVQAVRGVEAGADAEHRDVRGGARRAHHGHLRDEPEVLPGDVHHRVLPDVLSHLFGHRRHFPSHHEVRPEAEDSVRRVRGGVEEDVNAVNLYHYLSLRRRTDRAVSFGRTLACYMIVCKRASRFLLRTNPSRGRFGIPHRACVRGAGRAVKDGGSDNSRWRAAVREGVRTRRVTQARRPRSRATG
jgi:hypothetical protein